jgi:hypothetical protein
MNGDFSRLTFDVEKPYSRVLMQQGRVLLDSDWNEQADIQAYYLRMLIADLFGPFGGPAANCGFAVSNPAKANNEWTVVLGGGHYYVDGIPIALNADPTRSPATVVPPTGVALVAPYLVYLDVWEQHVTSLDDAGLRETALGLADTATRTKIVHQLRGASLSGITLPNPTADDDKWRALFEKWHPTARGQLTAWAKKGSTGSPDQDPCISPPEANYRGSDNRLYRVEVHTSGPAGTATFKWSRDNGSMVVAWSKTLGDDALIVMGVRDMVSGFSSGDWVELTNADLERGGQPGQLVKLSKVDGDKLTCVKGTKINSQLRTSFPRVRRWDAKAGFNEGGTIITEGKDFPLELGINISFAKPATAAPTDTNMYRTGDYWLIPARYATGDIDWPQGQPKPPHGVAHHYAPLASIDAANNVTDLRRKFKLMAA